MFCHSKVTIFFKNELND